MAPVFPTAVANFDQKWGLILRDLARENSRDVHGFEVIVHQTCTKQTSRTVLSY
jgi:hypothetical protein